jgi:hypothetical protein
LPTSGLNQMSASLSNTFPFPFILNTHILYNPIDKYCQVIYKYNYKQNRKV